MDDSSSKLGAASCTAKPFSIQPGRSSAVRAGCSKMSSLGRLKQIKCKTHANHKGMQTQRFDWTRTVESRDGVCFDELKLIWVCESVSHSVLTAEMCVTFNSLLTTRTRHRKLSGSARCTNGKAARITCSRLFALLCLSVGQSVLCFLLCSFVLLSWFTSETLLKTS